MHMRTEIADRQHRGPLDNGIILGLSVLAFFAGGPVATSAANDEVLIGQTFRGCVPTEIIDGDTLSVTCAGESHRVRLHCIDAPEMDQGDWGKRSRDYLTEITSERVTLYVEDIGYYGRVIGELSANGININRRLVDAGWAAEYPRYCDDPSYGRAQARAKEEKRGVWSEPGMHQTPWVWRRQ